MARELDDSSFELFDFDDVEPLSWDDGDDDGALFDDAPELSHAEEERLHELFNVGLGVEPVTRLQRAELLDAVLRAAGAEAPESVASSGSPRHLRVVEGGLSAAPASAEPAAALYAAPDAAPELEIVSETNEALRRHRSVSAQLRLSRVAAALAIVLLVAGGGIAYSLPTAYVNVAGGNSTVRLGVNLFGVTVFATAEDAQGQAMLDEANVNNLGYGDALRALATSMGGAGGTNASELNVEVSSSVTSLQRAALEDDAARVLGSHPAPPLPSTPSLVNTPTTPALPVSPVSPVRPQEPEAPAPVLATQLPSAANASEPAQEEPAAADPTPVQSSSDAWSQGSSSGTGSLRADASVWYEPEPAEQIDSAVADSAESIGDHGSETDDSASIDDSFVDSLGDEETPSPSDQGIQDSLLDSMGEEA